MSKIINTAGKVSRNKYILEQAARTMDAFSVLAESPLPDELKLEIYKDFKKLKRKQMILLPVILVGWIVFVSLVMTGLDIMTDFSILNLVESSVLMMLLFGALIAIPIYLIFKSIFKGDTKWDTYYEWYKDNEKSSHYSAEGLFRLFGIEEETAIESNERIAAEMKAQGKTPEQISAVIKAREDYQLEKGLRPETEEEENNRLKEQMRANGYTEEQIADAFGEKCAIERNN